MSDHKQAENHLPNTAILSSVSEPLLRWYKNRARVLPWREEPSAYRVWISEIMLQQTRVAAVIAYFERFLSALPDVAALAAVSDDQLMKLWQGLGYYNRARNLKKAAQIVVNEYHGQIPLEFHELLKLPGIGRYTAAAISSIAGGAPFPAVDGNVLRVVTRLTLCREDILKDRTKRHIEETLRPLYTKGPLSSMLNQAWMELGATVCIPNGAPHCAHCPLARFCLAHDNDCTAEFPIKQAKKKRRREQLTVLLLRRDDKIALRQRGSKGLLAGLYELPHLPGHLRTEEIFSALAARDFSVAEVRALPPAHHVFTHIEWDMTGFQVALKAKMSNDQQTSDHFIWASMEDVLHRYSIPAAFQYFLHDL